MSTPRDERYGLARSGYRRTPDSTAHGQYVTGQGMRPILPSLTAAFPTPSYPLSSNPGSQHNQYSARGSPGRSEAFSYGGQQNWSNSHLMSTYAYSNDHETRHPTPPSFSYPTRQSPGPTDLSRRLPPLNIPHPHPQGTREERWQQTSFAQGSYPPGAATHALHNTRSPMPSYPNAYEQYSSFPHGTASYPQVVSGAEAHRLSHSIPFGHDSHHGPHPLQSSGDWQSMLPSSHESHSVSPYSPPGPDMSAHSPNTPTDPIKKKRKRADAAQLKILNEVYTRTAFPTTEERQDLAKKLDMSARSVQIWFQNKRQSYRQSRTANTLPAGVHHSYAHSNAATADHHSTGVSGSSRGEVSVTSSSVSASYNMRSPPDVSSRSSSRMPPYPTDYRRGRSPDDSGHHKRLGGKSAY